MIKVNVECDPTLTGPVIKIVQALLSTVLYAEGVRQAEITLIFGNDDLLSNLKKQFFNVDQFTDVIAFRLNAADEAEIDGEIYISLPRAHENAQIYQEPYPRELARLIIHGGLHLLNYSDGTPNKRAEMHQREDDYLAKVPWENLFEALAS